MTLVKLACSCGKDDETHTLECGVFPAVKWRSKFDELHGFDPKYYSYICNKCGSDVVNSYTPTIADQMLSYRMCFTCNYWRAFAVEYASKHNELTIIDGRILSPGNRRTGEFRGCGGRRFDIEYIGASRYAGSKITTFDLWVGGSMPEDIRTKFPDTARFEDGETWEINGIKGLNSVINHHKPEYPLPKTFGIGVEQW